MRREFQRVRRFRPIAHKCHFPPRNPPGAPATMRAMNPTKLLSVSLLVATLGAGCSSTSSNTQRGAVGGAAAGAVIGGIIGNQSGEAKNGALLGAAAGGLAGAAIGNNTDRRMENASADRQVGYVVQQPPLAPTSAPYESMPPRPNNDAIWVPGYYDYVGGDQYRWMAGHWEVPPPGYRSWTPPAWQQSGNGYTYVRGRWQ